MSDIEQGFGFFQDEDSIPQDAESKESKTSNDEGTTFISTTHLNRSIPKVSHQIMRSGHTPLKMRNPKQNQWMLMMIVNAFTTYPCSERVCTQSARDNKVMATSVHLT